MDDVRKQIDEQQAPKLTRCAALLSCAEPKQRLRAGKVRLPDRQKPSGHRVSGLR